MFFFFFIFFLVECMLFSWYFRPLVLVLHLLYLSRVTQIIDRSSRSIMFIYIRFSNKRDSKCIKNYFYLKCKNVSTCVSRSSSVNKVNLQAYLYRTKWRKHTDPKTWKFQTTRLKSNKTYIFGRNASSLVKSKFKGLCKKGLQTNSFNSIITFFN